MNFFNARHRVCREVAGSVCAAVGTGIGLVGNGIGVGCSFVTTESAATVEHIARLGGRDAPVAKATDGFKVCTLREHQHEVRDVAYVERREVQNPEPSAVLEHAFHVRYLSGVEGAEVECRQSLATVEHLLHVRHVSRVEVLQSVNAFHVE